MNILIIIDMQEGAFFESDKYDVEGVIKRINLLSEHIREKAGKVIFIQHDGTKDDGLQPFTPGWEILSSLTKRKSDKTIRKTINCAFHKTELNEYLNDLGVEKLIVSGWATDLCVDSTIRTAVSLGYNVAVASDCHTVSNRPSLSAKQVIEHHNWLWENLLVPEAMVEVVPSSKLCN